MTDRSKQRAPVTLAQSIGLAFFIGSIGWSATRLVDSYRDSGISTSRLDDQKETLRREMDDVHSRLGAIEAFLRQSCSGKP